MPDELLRVEGLCAGYGASQVLEHLSFSMGHESVTIVGRNGMGKTTLCNTLMGLLKSSAGEVTFAGERIDGLNPEQVARRGIAYIPQGRRLFPSLSVDEHLAMFAKGTRGKRWTPAAVYELFHGSPSDASTAEHNSPVANSRCSPSAAPCSSTRRCT